MNFPQQNSHYIIKKHVCIVRSKIFSNMYYWWRSMKFSFYFINVKYAEFWNWLFLNYHGLNKIFFEYTSFLSSYFNSNNETPTFICGISEISNNDIPHRESKNIVQGIHCKIFFIWILWSFVWKNKKGIIFSRSSIHIIEWITVLHLVSLTSLEFWRIWWSTVQNRKWTSIQAIGYLNVFEKQFYGNFSSKDIKK